MKKFICSRAWIPVFAVLIGLTSAAPGRAGVVEHGFLSCFDHVDGQGRFYEVHRVWMPGNGPYQIDLTSADFDTYLRVETLQGFTLGVNDDGGEGLNARLIFRPPAAGWYRIIVTSYRPGASGNFRLRVTP